MSKTYDVDSAQSKVDRMRASMAGHTYRHYKGADYVVLDVVVDEATGSAVVVYQSKDRLYRWARTYADFTALVEVNDDLRFRFKKTERS